MSLTNLLSGRWFISSSVTWPPVLVKVALESKIHHKVQQNLAKLIDRLLKKQLIELGNIQLSDNLFYWLFAF